MSQTDIFQRKIGFRTKTAFLSEFPARITKSSGSQLGEKKEIVRNLLEKSRIYEISLESIFGTFGRGKLLETNAAFVYATLT